MSKELDNIITLNDEEGKIQEAGLQTAWLEEWQK